MHATWRAIRSLADAQDFASRVATVRCIANWAQLKFGRTPASQEATLKLRDVNLRVDLGRADLISYWEIWYEHSYDNLPEFSLVDAECVVDVGANIGAFTLYQVLMKKVKLVVAFEPSPTTFRRLTGNLEANSIRNVKAVNAAVGESCGELPFIDLPFSVNSRVAEKESSSARNIPCVTLDSALKTLGVKSVDLLKVDTEGYEIQVLKGARETLQRTKRVVIEVHRESEKDECDALLVPQGFRFAARIKDLLFYSH
jgi:FkbM family methyltransferase